MLEAIGIRIARHIQPVPAPALAVMGRGEEAVHQFLPGVRRLIVQELRRFGRRGRHPDQIEIRASQQGNAVRLRRSPQTFLLQRGMDERVYWIRGGIRGRHRQCGFRREPESPVIPLFRADRRVLQRICSLRNDRRRTLPHRALINPEPKRFHFVGSDLPADRHRRLIQTRDQSIKAALLRVARHDARAVLAASQRGIARGQTQLRKLHRVAVAVPATLFKDGLNVLLK